MGSKLGTTLAFFSMMAMMGGGIPSSPSTEVKPGVQNWQKKCFRPGCENNREYDKLYCSAECNKLHKQQKRENIS